MTVRTTRVDPPHARSDAPADLPADRGEAADQVPLDELDEPAMLWSQMHTQARQLAELLAERQRQLDRREANLHAQTAGFEQQARDARLWWNDCLVELAQRETRLARPA